MRTFTVGFGDERYDERAYARAVAERYGTEHEEIVVEPDVTELLPRLARAFDEPLGDEAALPQFVVSELARRHVTVALTGDGGDEAFAGYERYAAVGLAGRVALPGAGSAGRALRWAGRREPRSRTNRAGRLLELGALPAEARYARVMEVFPAALRAELWEPAFVPSAVATAELLGPAPEDGIAGLQRLDVRTYLPGDLLLKADIASMAHSLEVRSPLLDHDRAGAGRVAAGLAEGGRAARQGRAPPRVRRRAPARGREAGQDRLRRADRPLVPRGAARRSRPTSCSARRRARAGSCGREWWRACSTTTSRAARITPTGSGAC